MLWTLLKKIFFSLDPERAHYLSMNLLQLGLKIPGISNWLIQSWKFEHPALQQNLDGMVFKNPVGLAAGFDKDGRWLHLLQQLGFGFIEVGTVTPKPQSGNPKPRLFRLVKDQSVINRMGFNNNGVEALAKRLSEFQKHKNVLIGGNIGKNKDSSNEEAAADYLKCFHALHQYVDYFAINVSSPNTANLRALQDKEPLMQLLIKLQAANQNYPVPKPIYLKIAPDLNKEQILDVIDAAIQSGIQGLILTNTTISRPDFLLEKEKAKEAGGLSGKALSSLTTDIIKTVREANSTLSIVGVGGIFNGNDAVQKLNAGAQLIQVYTGMIFEGPWMVKKIKKELVRMK
ncbi:MAG: quinone-dependent dihydroorotate dehydrogenase [Saprospiraceae bacterium]|nr:quinone-dependent dihydroorotate dehydrogenase [Saprospiraceae bacterium]